MPWLGKPRRIYHDQSVPQSAFAPFRSAFQFGCVLAVLILLPASGWANGLPDGFPVQGYGNGTPPVSTDYYAADEGTASNPLTLTSCPVSACPPWPDVYQQSNSYRQNVPMWVCPTWPGLCDHWTLIMNNEEAFQPLSPGTQGNPGPPDQSLPRALPGYGIFGFATLYGNANFPGDTLWRAQMVLNVSSQFPNPTIGRVPYMAIGAFTGWGAPSPIGVLNPSNGSKLTTMKFGARLWQFLPTTNWTDYNAVIHCQPLLVDAYVTFFADWGTHPKAIQVNFFHWVGKSTDPAPPATACPDHSYYDLTGWYANDFDWPIQESVYHPGARFAYVDAEDLQSLCGITVPRLQWPDQEADFSIDIDALFHCAAQAHITNPYTGMPTSTPVFGEPLPSTTDIPITSASWATEASGKDGGIWIDVHQMRMVSANQSLVGSTLNKMLSESPRAYGPETESIRQLLTTQCTNEPGCQKRAAAVARRDPTVYTPPATKGTPRGILAPYYWRSGTTPVR